MCGYFCIGFINYIFMNKSLIFKMVECISIEHNSIDTLNLNNHQFRLNKIGKIEDHFITEVNERELMSKKLSKYFFF